MRRLRIGNVELPRVYVVRSKYEAEECRLKGIPYIVWRGSDEDLVRLVMYPTLKKMFPGVMWDKVLGLKRKRKQLIVSMPGHRETEPARGGAREKGPVGKKDVDHGSGTADVARDVREFSNPGDLGFNDMRLDEYVGDLSATVNIEELQALHLLPSFLDDIATNIKRNIGNLAWWEGYNKKLGVPVGNFNAASEMPNLMILDISGSIPRSIAATMLTLIDTLRSQANADLIITASRSEFFPANTELPDPQELRNRFNLGNEAGMFYEILRTKVKGRKFANVISFGDEDCPTSYATFRENLGRSDIEGTEVRHVWHYHTWRRASTGYAKWADELVPKGNRHVDVDWCSMMVQGRG